MTRRGRTRYAASANSAEKTSEETPMLPAHLGRTLAFALLVVGLLLAGCAGQTGTAATPAPEQGDGAEEDGGDGGGPTSDLCSILSADEVAEIAGAEVTDTTDNQTDCDYTVGEADLINVRYESAFDPDLETARMICDSAEEVSGIGDQALWCPDINVLYFNKGDQSLAVQLVFILTDPSRSPKEIASDVARLIAEEL
jgi:hypothetical protein